MTSSLLVRGGQAGRRAAPAAGCAARITAGLPTDQTGRPEEDAAGPLIEKRHAGHAP